MSETRKQLYALAIGLSVGVAIGLVYTLTHPEQLNSHLPVKGMIE